MFFSSNVFMHERSKHQSPQLPFFVLISLTEQESHRIFHVLTVRRHQAGKSFSVLLSLFCKMNKDLFFLKL